MRKQIKILSFFSGGGFLDMGFEQAGFEVVWTNEFDSTFAQLHAAGITSWRQEKGIELRAEIFNTKSIADISSEEIIQEAFPDGKPKLFGIIGGPPCQDFSINGKMKGFEGERGRMTIEFFEKIDQLEPTFFVMENVTGLVRNKSYKTHLTKLITNIRHTYHLDHEILNALDFGVPQSRERVFFVGIHKDSLDENSLNNVILGSWFSWPRDTPYQNAKQNYKWPQQQEAFGQKLRKPNGVPIELCVECCLVPAKERDNVPNAKEYFNFKVPLEKLQNIKEGETNRPSFKRLHRYKYSPTACYGNNEVHLHPYEHRRLSVREVLRIQGVPDSYVLPSELSMTKKFKMIGNGVPVPLATAVANAVYEFLEEKIIHQPKHLEAL